MKPTKEQIKAARVKNVKPSRASKEASDYLKLLSDEHRMLQDKIDKIGSFRFIIKGWSVTVLIAASAAGANTSSLLSTAFVGVAAAVMLYFFLRLELEQVVLSRLFGLRAGKLEDAILNIGRADTKSRQIAVPYIAHELALRTITKPRWPRLHSEDKAEHQLKRQAHRSFYVTLIIFSLAIPSMKYRAIKSHAYDLKAWLKPSPFCLPVRTSTQTVSEAK